MVANLMRWARYSLLTLVGSSLLGCVAVGIVSQAIADTTGGGISPSEVFEALAPLVRHATLAGLLAMGLLYLILAAFALGVRPAARADSPVVVLLVLAPAGVAILFAILALQAVGGLAAFVPRPGG